MGQDPNQPYPGQYGQPPQQPSGYPPQGAYQPPQGSYQQQSGYQQGAYPPPNPGYQQPYGAAPGQLYNTGHPNGATTMNMDPNTGAGVSYFTWIAGLIVFLMEKQNRFVRFHAMQSILLNVVAVAAWLIFFVLSIILAFSGLGCVLGALEIIVWIGAFVLWLICVINAFQGKYFKLPVIGDMAERWANPGVPTM